MSERLRREFWPQATHCVILGKFLNDAGKRVLQDQPRGSLAVHRMDIKCEPIGGVSRVC